MRLLDKLQRRFGHLAVPHVTEGLIVCQVLAYLCYNLKPEFLNTITLVPIMVGQGEIWRMVTFLCEPPLINPVFAIFFWYMFYLMGTALESTWGTFRYNVYLLVGWAATVAVAFVVPTQATPNLFLQGSVFLAFAYLYPEFQLYLFFILPIKIRWLAVMQWVFYLYLLFFGTFIAQLMVLASICNFMVFFGYDIVLRMKSGRRKMSRKVEQISRKDTPRHTCCVCGATDLSRPDMLFRYCSKCAGSPCYCEEHLRTHEHITNADSASAE